MNNNSCLQKVHELDAVIQKIPNNNATYGDIPYDVKNKSEKGCVKSSATFDDSPYEGSLIQMATPGNIIGIQEEISTEI